MCAIKNLSKTKALETAPNHENEILTHIFNFQRIILKPATDGFQISTDSSSAWVLHQALADWDAYLFCFLKLDFLNTKCEYKVREGVKVNQLFTFFTSIITRNNGGTLGLGTSKNVSGVSNSSLQYCCDGSFFSILFAFSAIKRPAKELRLSFMSGEKYVNKIFLLFSGSESA